MYGYQIMPRGSQPAHSRQHFMPRDSAVIAEARRRRKTTLTVSGDGEWLRAYGREPRKLLSEMAERGALLALGGGRYLVVDPGQTLIEQAAAWQIALDGVVHPYGDYYLGFMSAIVEHHLTDLESPTIYVALHRRSNVDREILIANRPVIFTYVSKPTRWFGVETVRVSRAERYQRSDIERTLIDCLDRPRLCGSTEVWVRAWERALRRDEVDVAKICDYAMRLGPSVSRRAGFMLTVGGHGEEARQRLSYVVKPGGSVLLDPSAKARPNAERDTTWGVALNVTRDFIDGMFAYGK